MRPLIPFKMTLALNAQQQFRLQPLSILGTECSEAIQASPPHISDSSSSPLLGDGKLEAVGDLLIVRHDFTFFGDGVIITGAA